MPKSNSKKQTSDTKPNVHIKDFLLLLSVPLGIGLIAALLVFVPSLFANPKHDFIYSYCASYQCSNDYIVNADGFVEIDLSRVLDLDDYETAQLRYYDISENSTKNLTLEQAQNYQLEASSKSPDGYTLTHENQSTGFLFWGEYEDGWYVKNGALKKQVEVSQGRSYYSDDIKFLGWVK